MNVTKYTVAIAFLCVLIGCGEKKLDMRMGSNSVEEVMQEMNKQEKIAFINDMDLLIALKGGNPYIMNGYTASEVKEEAIIARQYVHEKNSEFLSPLIKKMEAEGKNAVRLHVNKAGIFSGPQVGHIAEDYTLNYLKSLLGDNAVLKSDMNSSANSAGNGLPQEQTSALEQKTGAAPRTMQSANIKLMGDKVDDNHNAEPNTQEDAANKAVNKSWQDKNGFIHYPDGSISSGPVD